MDVREQPYFTVKVTDSYNTAPTISGGVSGQTFNDNATITPFSSIRISDPDVNDIETLNVQLTNPGMGRLTAASGSYNVSTGIYSATGSVAQVQNDLNTLIFTPTNLLTAGSTQNVSFNVKVTDLHHTAATTQVGITVRSHSASTLDYSSDSSAREINMSVGTVPNVIGGSGDDIFRGNSGNNVLDGGSGNNQLWAAAGDDKMIGGSGSNGYWWGQGDGHDVVQEGGRSSSAGADALYLYNVVRNGYSGERQGNDFVISLANGESLTVAGWYAADPASRIQGWVFGDTVVAWNDGQTATVELAQPAYAQENIHQVVVDDRQVGIVRGGNGDDTLAEGAMGGQLWGGLGGNDRMAGSSGSTAYWWGRGNGQDVISQAAVNSGDALYLYNVARNGYSGERQGDDYVIKTGDGSTLTVQGWYSAKPEERIQGWVFGSEVVAWNDGQAATVELSDPCYALNEVHQVTAADGGAMTFRGSSGSDVLTAGSGGSKMWGGAGSDVMTGGSGTDEYWWGQTDGQDVINGRSDNSQDSIMLYNMSLSSVHSQLSGNDLVISLDGSSDTLTIKDWAKGGGYQLNSFNIGGKMYQLAADGKSWSAK